MKKIVITSLAVGPLLAGCVSDQLGPELSSESAPPPAHALADVKSQLKGLRWRVSQLNKKLAMQARLQAVDPDIDSAHIDIKQRLAELEQASRNRPAPATSGNAQAPSPSSDNRSDITQRIAELNEKLNKLVVTQSATKEKQSELENGLEDDRALVIDYLKSLDEKIKKLELAQTATKAAKPATDPADAALTQRVAKLESLLKTTTSKYGSLAADLEKDRALVVDYLDDIDKRLANLESAQTKAPAAPAKP